MNEWILVLRIALSFLKACTVIESDQQCILSLGRKRSTEATMWSRTNCQVRDIRSIICSMRIYIHETCVPLALLSSFPGSYKENGDWLGGIVNLASCSIQRGCLLCLYEFM